MAPPSEQVTGVEAGLLKVFVVVFVCFCCVVLFIKGGVFDGLGDVCGAFRGLLVAFLAVLEVLLGVPLDGLGSVPVDSPDDAVPLHD